MLFPPRDISTVTFAICLLAFGACNFMVVITEFLFGPLQFPLAFFLLFAVECIIGIALSRRSHNALKNQKAATFTLMGFTQATSVLLLICFTQYFLFAALEHTVPYWQVTIQGTYEGLWIVAIALPFVYLFFVATLSLTQYARSRKK